MHLIKTPSLKFFAKSINLEIGDKKNANRYLDKINLHYHSVNDPKLTVYHQLFSWTLVGLSECPIKKMIGSQGHPNVLAVP